MKMGRRLRWCEDGEEAKVVLRWGGGSVVQRWA